MKIFRGPVLAQCGALFCALLAVGMVGAQELAKSAINVDAGNTKQIGATFTYRLTYNCSSTSGPCLSAQVVDLLPAEVQFISTVPNSPTGDVATINVTANFGGSGRTRVQFVMITPLPAGNSGDLLVNVRFPIGSTANGTVAINSADGINLATTPGTFTTPPVTVTAVATVQTTLTKTLLSGPANLDLPESYRLRISVPNNPGALNLTAIGPVVDTLPPGVVFSGATPAADCEPGCVGTTPATLTWTSPCALPLTPGGNCDITVNVVFPSATFPSGSNVTNQFTTDATPLGETPRNLGIGTVTHPVTTFVPTPNAAIGKNVTGASPNPPTLNQAFSYELVPSNSGNVPLDNLVLIDTLPIQLQLSSVSTGRYNSLNDFAAGVGVQVSYEKNTAPGVFTLWGSSPNSTTNTTLTMPPPGLGAGEYPTRLRWEFGQAQVGMNASTRPLISGQIINPDQAGNPVAFGNVITNCVDLTAVFTAGPTNIARNSCRNFTLSGPFVQLNPAKDGLSGAGPFNPGQTVNFRLRVRSDARSSDPVPLESLIVTDLLPLDLVYTVGSWAFDAQATGLPAPQVFNEIPNFAGTGRTLLRWRWNPGSGNLGVNQQVWIILATSIRSGALAGALTNNYTLDHDVPGLGLRCSGASQTDPLDLDGDGDTAETLCREGETINVAPIAQLISSKAAQSVCNASFVLPPATGESLPGGEILYRLRVQNVGTVPMQNFTLIDILPEIGDTGVRDTNPRNSQFPVNLVAPVSPPPGTSIFYSTAINPCRGEVGGPTTGCTAPNWTTVAPTPLSSVRSFKVEFGARVINPFDFVEFAFPLHAPAVLPPPGQTARNSFAYQSARADGIGNLAAEPQAVPVQVGACTVTSSLGNFVWKDSDGNGLQDDGQTGVNGVFVRLLKVGVDGIAGTLDDEPVNVGSTQNDSLGNPGWYQFPNLDPDTYFVCFSPPANFLPTLADVGGNDAIDSDGNPLTACTAPVVLGAGEDNPTLDFGLVQAAALGDYVWADRNGNGVQDETPDFGINGVTVELYADNGDGICAVASDALVANTLTADDAFGRSGYYVFPDLIPAQPYCVRFLRPSPATNFTGPNLGGNDTLDSDASVASGLTQVVTLAPAEYNDSIDAGLVFASGPLALGDQVWFDGNNNGIFEPQAGEVGIDNVLLDLYLDFDNDGNADTNEYLGRTATQTNSGFSGRYRFGNLAPGNYLVVVEAGNFAFGQPLFGRTTATGNDPAADPDDDFNGDDNGRLLGPLTLTLPVTLTAAGEPTSEDGDNNTNLTVDFGFIVGAAAVFDFGDLPDAGVGTAQTNYNTLVSDNGAQHQIGVAGSPILGTCVDADSGLVQGLSARDDNTNGGAPTVGSCLAGNDEDGVVGPQSFPAGSTPIFSITAAPGTNACQLSGWFDWNHDGDFADAGETITIGSAIAAGTSITLPVTVPATAATGNVYARFRCASVVVNDPFGPALDGEVEDYVYQVTGQDLGDLPDLYGTLIASNGARHLVDPANAIYLGACVDFESDGQPNPTANADDSGIGTDRVGLCFDDEDGVVIPLLAACSAANVSVTASAAARVDAFFDWNNDGDFADVGEQPINNAAVLAGSNSFPLTVPCTTAPGTVYARFRLSSIGGLAATGVAADGEVEDYAATVVGVDFGDLPAPFATSFAGGGPLHALLPVSPVFLGGCVDSEADGQPNATASGDDLGGGSSVLGVCVGNDDEDGVILPTITACLGANITVNANAAGLLGAWIDWNRDGDFNDPTEQIADDLALVAGANSLPISAACNLNPGTAGLRFRFSSAGVVGPTGAAADGEVEDYQALLQGADFGDAPASYGTQVAATGASHGVDPTGSLFLGNCVDSEIDGQPNAAANGDDLGLGNSSAGACTGNDDEDGVIVPALVACQAASASVSAAAPGLLDAWIDFNQDGDFLDAGERITTAQAVLIGANTVNFTVPCAAPSGDSYARFRLSSAGVATPTGAAADGEVEDYVVTTTRRDYGDLPDPSVGIGNGNYATLEADGGPWHTLIPGLFMGVSVDHEADGQPNLSADGDDLAVDDEDGVSFPIGGFELGSPARATVIASNSSGSAATLCGFIDWNSDGDFADVSETATLPVPNGSVAASFVLNFGLAPLTANPNPYSRFRLSSAPACSANAGAPDGEVEDYLSATTTNGALSLGNLVWEDLNNDGLVSAGEPGVAGVPVNLHQDTNQDCIADAAALATQITDAAGNYLFIDLLPGIYLVQIAPPSTWLGATGSGRYAPSGPFEPAPDPDNDVNDDDNGNNAAALIHSCGVELLAKQEPINDGDGDFNSNLSVDFGLVRNFDVALIKTLSPGQANTLFAPNQTVNFTLTVFNQGSIDATNITLSDTIPNGMVLNDPAWTAGGQTATMTLPGPLAAGASTSVTIALAITNNAIGEFINRAEISAASDDSGTPRPDKDSSADADPNNDGPPVDDETGNTGGDEDDADFASVRLVLAVPVNQALALVLLALLLLGLGWRQRRLVR